MLSNQKFLGQEVYRVGIERVFDSKKGIDQGGGSQRIPQPDTCQGHGFRKSVDDQQVRMIGKQTCRGFPPKGYIGFIDDYRFIIGNFP